MADDKFFTIQSVDTSTPLEKLNQMAADCWLGLKTDTGLPAWKSYDPLQEPEIIPYSYFVNAAEEGGKLKFTYDLIGNELAAIYGEVTGQTLATFEKNDPDMSEVATRVRQIFTKAVEEQRAQVGRGNLSFPIRDMTHFEMVVLPFTGDDGRIAELLAVFRTS